MASPPGLPGVTLWLQTPADEPACISLQISVIEGTYLAIEHMSLQNGGKGGAVVNVASFGGKHKCGQNSQWKVSTVIMLL